MNRIRSLAKRQRRHAVVLRHDNVTAPAQIDQRKIHRIRARADHLHLGII